AELPVARLLTVFPSGGKAGSQFEVSLTGADLDEANQIHFSHTNTSAKPKLGETGLPEANKFLVTIATNVTPGVYEAGVVGRFGISNLRAFVVGDLPEIIVSITNKSPANATTISLGIVINGHSEANAAGFYKFTVRKK